MKALTVLHTESSLGWGGQENRTLNEMLVLRDMGQRCLLACQPGAHLGDRAREAGFEVFEIAMRSLMDMNAILGLRCYMAKARVDVVNTHSGRDTQVAGLAARSLFGRRPLIVRTRHLALPITSKFTYSVLPDHVAAVSTYVADYLASAGVPREQLTAVPTGIDLGRYVSDPLAGGLRAELGLPADTFLVGTVAILRKKKGHTELLEAVPEVMAQFPAVHFVFAGDGPQRENLERRVAELGLVGRVHFLGLRRDVTNILQSLDVFVLPTHQEALGTAFVEAGAMGLPAVGTQVDGVPEVVIDGETGLLVPVKDSAALANAINSLLASPDLRERMGAAARQHVVAHFSREAMGRRMVELYNRLLG